MEYNTPESFFSGRYVFQIQRPEFKLFTRGGIRRVAFYFDAEFEYNIPCGDI